MAPAGGMALAPAEQIPSGRALVRTKWRAVNGVNDRRHSQLPRRQTAEKPGFGAVGVHDVRPELANDLLQAQIAGRIAPGIDRAAQAGDDPRRHVSSPALLE